jgi:hypothetical protein
LRLLTSSPTAGPIVVTRERADDGGVRLHLSEPGRALTHDLLEGIDAAMARVGVGESQRIEVLGDLVLNWMDPHTLQRGR